MHDLSPLMGRQPTPPRDRRSGAVFGYGSLVNRDTHDMATTHVARLSGWRRVWVQAANRPVAFLSVERHDTVINGLLIDVPETDWATLDAREHAYLRRDVTHQTAHDGPARHAVTYEANPKFTTAPSTGHPILLSYLDVVVAGYSDLMGADGPPHFFETTVGWGPVLDDRAAPRYPRSRPVSPLVRATVDDALSLLSVPVKPSE